MNKRSQLANRISSLSPEQIAKLKRSLKSSRHGEIEVIQPHSRNRNSFQLSFAQERLWFIDQFDPGNTAYNLLAQYRIPGSVDHEALIRSLSEVVARHESLRTTFYTIDGRPSQVVAPELSIPIPIIDLGGCVLRGGRAICSCSPRPVVAGDPQCPYRSLTFVVIQ
jgi:hypothetical protein